MGPMGSMIPLDMRAQIESIEPSNLTGPNWIGLILFYFLMEPLALMALVASLNDNIPQTHWIATKFKVINK